MLLSFCRVKFCLYRIDLVRGVNIVVVMLLVLLLVCLLFCLNMFSWCFLVSVNVVKWLVKLKFSIVIFNDINFLGFRFWVLGKKFRVYC